MEGGHAVVGDDQDVAVRGARVIGPDRVNHLLNCTIGNLIGGLDVVLVTGDFNRVLAGANRIGVTDSSGLAGVRQGELVPGAVGLLNIDHHQVGVGVLGDGA